MWLTSSVMNLFPLSCFLQWRKTVGSLGNTTLSFTCRGGDMGEEGREGGREVYLVDSLILLLQFVGVGNLGVEQALLQNFEL